MFKVGDRVVLLEMLPDVYFGEVIDYDGSDGLWLAKFEDFGEFDDDGTWWISEHEDSVVLEEIYNSPLYKALNE